jgi:hypothetical protein
MSTTSRPQNPGDDDRPDPGSSGPDEAPGAEIGMSEGEGTTFEPEEDAEA